MSQKLVVVLTYSYEVDPEHYENKDPVDMAALDISIDPMATILDAEWTVSDAKLVEA